MRLFPWPTGKPVNLSTGSLAHDSFPGGKLLSAGNSFPPWVSDRPSLQGTRRSLPEPKEIFCQASFCLTQVHARSIVAAERFLGFFKGMCVAPVGWGLPEGWPEPVKMPKNSPGSPCVWQSFMVLGRVRPMGKEVWRGGHVLIHLDGPVGCFPTAAQRGPVGGAFPGGAGVAGEIPLGDRGHPASARPGRQIDPLAACDRGKRHGVRGGHPGPERLGRAGRRGTDPEALQARRPETENGRPGSVERHSPRGAQGGAGAPGQPGGALQPGRAAHPE